MISEQEKQQAADIQKATPAPGESIIDFVQKLYGDVVVDYETKVGFMIKQDEDPSNLYLVILIAILAVLLGFAYYSRRK